MAVDPEFLKLLKEFKKRLFNGTPTRFAYQKWGSGTKKWSYDWKDRPLQNQDLIDHFYKKWIDRGPYKEGALGFPANQKGIIKRICFDLDNKELKDYFYEAIAPKLDSLDIDYILEHGGDDYERGHASILTHATLDVSKEFLRQFMGELGEPILKGSDEKFLGKIVRFDEIYGGNKFDENLRFIYSFHIKRMRRYHLTKRDGSDVGDHEDDDKPDVIPVIKAFNEMKILDEDFMKGYIKDEFFPPSVVVTKTNYRTEEFIYDSLDLPLPTEDLPGALKKCYQSCPALAGLLNMVYNEDGIQKAGLTHHNIGLAVAGTFRFYGLAFDDPRAKDLWNDIKDKTRFRSDKEHHWWYGPDKSPYTYMWTCDKYDQYFGMCEGCPWRGMINSPRDLIAGKKLRKEIKDTTKKLATLDDIRKNTFPKFKQHVKDKYCKDGFGAFALRNKMGSGKCYGIDTPILMYDGSIRMVQDIQVGDLLMGPDSKPRKVTSLARGREEMFKVIPVKGDPFTCNRSHILSFKTSGHPVLGTGSVINLTLDEYFNELKKNKSSRYWYLLHRPSKLEFSSNIKLGLDPYFLGLWLGDGDSRNPSITTMDLEIVDFLENYSKSSNLMLRKGYEKGKASTYHITSGNSISVNPIRNEIQKLNLYANKHIPKEYLTSSVESRLQLLAGILDSDGYLGNNVFDLIQKNERLANDIVFLCRSLGIASYVKPCKKYCVYKGENRWGDYFRISISGDMDKIPTRLPRKQATPRNQKKSHLVTGFKLESLGEGNYYGFTLEGPDRLHLLGDFTVGHNSVTAYDLIAELTREFGVNILLSVHDGKAAMAAKDELKSRGVDSFALMSHANTFGHQATPPKEVRLADFDCLFYKEIQGQAKAGVLASEYKEEYCKGCPLFESCYYPKQYSEVMEEEHKVVIIQHAHLSCQEVLWKLMQKKFDFLIIDENFLKYTFQYIDVRDAELTMLKDLKHVWCDRLVDWMEGREEAFGRLIPSESQLQASYNAFKDAGMEYRVPDLIRLYNQHRAACELTGIEVVYELPSIPMKIFLDGTLPVNLIKKLTGIYDLILYGDDEIIDISAVNPGNLRYQIMDVTNSNRKLDNSYYFDLLMTKLCEIIRDEFAGKKFLITCYGKHKELVKDFILNGFPQLLNSPYCVDIGLMNKGTNKWATFDGQAIIAGRYRTGKHYKDEVYRLKAVHNWYRKKWNKKEIVNLFPIGIDHKTTIMEETDPFKCLMKIDGELKEVHFLDHLVKRPKRSDLDEDENFWNSEVYDVDSGDMEQCERIRLVPEVAKVIFHFHNRFMPDLVVSRSITFQQFLALQSVFEY